MKIFTHTLVVYDNGWCWKWKKKIPSNTYTIDGSLILYVALAILVADKFQ